MRKEIDAERFVESVYHVVYIGNIVRHYESLLGSSECLSQSKRRILRMSVQWNTLLLTVSLQDEINSYLLRHKSENAKVQRKVESYKKIVAPVMKVLREWPDLRSFRNNVLAHNFRDDKNGSASVLLTNGLKSYKLPNTIVDLVKLFKVLNVVTSVAKEIFLEEYNEAINIADSFEKEPNKKLCVDEEFEKLNNALQEVNQNISRYNTELNRTE
jgi:hypothetical protein